MGFVLIFDPEPLLSAPQFFGPFASQSAAKRYAEATGMTLGRDFDQAAAVECRFRELLPAGFRPVFDYSALATFGGWPTVWVGAWE